jgi:formate hydrogenlyase subunit 3/multisubunit Na+/H+ antiporter MnhD subunit
MEVLIRTLAILDIIAGIVFLGLCIPLVQRKIGRNAAYGVRIPRTLASDEAWYAVNHGVGKAGVFMSIGMIIFSLGMIVATNIELKKLDRSKGDWHADREEMS